MWSDYAQKIEDKALLESNEIKGLIRNVEKAIDAHDAYDTEVEQSADNVNEGALVALMMHVLGKHGISVQRYWNGALVGPDCRHLLEMHKEILEDIRKGMVAAQYGASEATDFLEKHTSVLKELLVVSGHTRRVNGDGESKLLSEAQRAELKGACAAFGVAWRATFVDKHGAPRILTPKGHIVEVHVPWFVDYYGICGVFGEDGAEALHVVDSLCRRIVRQMRNPEARNKAHTLHHTARRFTPELHRDIVERQSRKKRDAANALAEAAARAAGLVAALPTPLAAAAAEDEEAAE